MANSPPMLMVDAPHRTGGEPAVRDLSGQWYATMGINRDEGGVSLATTPTAFANVAADEPWVYAVLNRVAMDAQSVPLVCYAKRGTGKALVRPEDNPGDTRQADIQYLLDNVNNQSMSGSDLKAWHIMSEYIWGEDYWLKVSGRLGGPPQELHWLRPSNMEPILNAQGWISSYKYSGATGLNNSTNTSIEYKRADVIASLTVNPKDPTRGLSFLQSVKYDIAVDRQAAMHTAYTLANWGIPAGAWVAPKGADLSTQDQSAIRRALRALRGPKAAGKSAILPEGLQWQSMAINPKDAEWLQARKVARMTICAAAGVPLVLVGDDDKNTVYGNLRDAERVYWRGTVVTKLNRWADTLQNWLLPDFGDDARASYQIAFDYSAVAALRPELTAEMNAYTVAMDRETITPNEYRRHFNLGPDVPWGDNPMRSTRLIQEPPDELPPGTPQLVYGALSAVPVDGGKPYSVSGTAAGAVSGAREAVKDWSDIATAVKIPLKNEYPKKTLGWIKKATWSYNPAVPLNAIDTSQPPKDGAIIDGVVAQLSSGANTDPVVLLLTSGDPKLKIADGRHRVVGYGQTSRTTIPAYIATGLRKSDERAWQDMYAAKYGADAVRENPLPRAIYRLDAVKAWTADRSTPLDAVATALGVPASAQLRVGLGRRYNADQLWNGYAPHGYSGIKET